MRTYAKLAAAGALSLALVSGSAFAATTATKPLAKAATTKVPMKKVAYHAAKKDEKKAHPSG